MNIFGFFGVVSRNVVKWWQIHITPILRIDNNKTGADRYEGGDGSLGNQNVVQTEAQTMAGQDTQTDTQVVAQNTQADNKSVSVQNSDSDSADAMAILNRINKEKNEERIHDIEEARRKREEEERVAAIMSSSKVDVGAFIEEGRHKANENVSPDDEQVESADNSETSQEDNSATDEQMRKAQEIIDRLNREAAEDEAKKQAEIEAAKAQVQADGLLQADDLEAALSDEEELAESSESAQEDSAATDEQMRRAQEIIDRLNREAAEDEAKKQEEIEAAKAQAKEAGL